MANSPDPGAPGRRVPWRGLVRAWAGLAVVAALPVAAARADDADPTGTTDADDAGDIQLVIEKPFPSPVVEGKRVDDYGRPRTVVSEDQIRELDAQDLPSALRRVPGVVISRHNPIGSFGGGEGGAVFIRGQGANRPGAGIQTQVDGVPKRIGVWDHPLMDVLSIDPVDHVDVRKGADPVFNGNAAFGVVNQVTKRRREEGMGGSLRLEGGSYGTFIDVLEFGAKQGRFDTYLVQSYRRSDGHRRDADGELAELFGRVGYQISEAWYGSGLVSASRNFANDPGGVFPDSPPPDGRYETQDLFTILSLENQYDWGDGAVKAFFEVGEADWRGEFADPPPPPGVRRNTNTKYRNGGVRTRQNLRTPWTGGVATVGFDYDLYGGKVRQQPLQPPAPATETDRESFALYMPWIAYRQRVELPAGFFVIPSGGVRWFAQDEFQNEWGPQAGLVVGRGQTRVFANYARGVNYPGVFTAILPQLPGPFAPFGPEDFSPEIVHHAEVGVIQEFGSWLTATATYFHDRGRDRFLIVGPPPLTFSNIESYRIQGVEASVTVRPLEGVSFFAGATYLDADPGDLPYAPRWSASGGLNWAFLERFLLSVDVLYVSDYQQLNSRGATAVSVPIGDYTLVNARLAYQVPLPTQRVGLELFVVGENLGDADYQLKFGYPMPGINGRGGMILRF